MGDGYFGFGEVNEFSPDYGGIDWRSIYERRMDRLGIDLPRPAWFEAADEQGELMMQLNQENFIIYLNKTNPELDTIAIVDPRDGVWIMFSRTDMGDDFDKVRGSHHTEALVVQSKYPLAMIANWIMGRAGVDIQNLETEGFPEDFGGLPPAVSDPE